LRLFEGVRLTTSDDDGREGAAPPGTGALRFRELRTTLAKNEAGMFRPRGADEREMTLAELWWNRQTPPQGVKASDITAELHSRIVRIVSLPLLPFLAVFLALGRRRSDRFAGFAVGIIGLIVYERVIDFGKNVAEAGQISPWVGLWLPFLVFALLCVGLFARSALTVPSTSTLGLFSVFPVGGRRSASLAGADR
jgi:lipopolysaccharide export system permease protein